MSIVRDKRPQRHITYPTHRKFKAYLMGSLEQFHADANCKLAINLRILVACNKHNDRMRDFRSYVQNIALTH